MRYDRRLKRYFASDRFAPRFLEPDATRYLTQLVSIARGALTADETWLSEVPDFAAVPLPRRKVNAAILKQVLSCVRRTNSIEIRYQSLSANRPTPEWRWITPHAFGFDGMRWHVRAFCHIDQEFKDFLLPRILDVKEFGQPAAKATDDKNWFETVLVALKPHPALTSAQQRVVSDDFGMSDGLLNVPVKIAMLYYFLKRLGLDFHEAERDPQQQHIVLADSEAVRASLERAQRKKRA
jgi:predicted DNA-binding transcriptional regulator YafY